MDYTPCSLNCAECVEAIKKLKAARVKLFNFIRKISNTDGWKILQEVEHHYSYTHELIAQSCILENNKCPIAHGFIVRAAQTVFTSWCYHLDLFIKYLAWLIVNILLKDINQN
ncbi:GSCOCG00004474001-RA-CDS [Cotesia congregata]|nr:GSCOCG00004474001-RA-CDS [Cotesia congregata]